MNLLRFRPSSRTLRVEDRRGGQRKVKVTISDNQIVQQVEDDEQLHATAAPETIRLGRRYREPKTRTRFRSNLNTGLWVPLPGGEEVVD